jgi:hypothetical protein
MTIKPKKISSESKIPTANQKISAALMTANYTLNLYEAISDEQLRKVTSDVIKFKRLSLSELKNRLIDALFNLEKITKELEIYKGAFSKIQLAIDDEKKKSKGGRPINKWAIYAFECAKKYQHANGKLPSAEMLKRLVTSIAESGGQFGEIKSDGVFSIDTAKQYLKYFKNNLDMFIALDADHWFELYEGRYHWTKL